MTAAKAARVICAILTADILWYSAVFCGIPRYSAVFCGIAPTCHWAPSVSTSSEKSMNRSSNIFTFTASAKVY